MPKIRGIKPEFWTDEDVVELSIPARLLFIGLWNFACDNGHVTDKPKQIKMRILPADDVNVDLLLDELVHCGRITREIGFLTIRRFTDHQKPHKRWWTTCDHPECSLPDGTRQQVINGSQPSSSSHNNRGTTVDTGRPTADGDGDGDGDGDFDGELGGAGGTHTPPDQPPASRKRSATRGTRLPTNWIPSEKVRTDLARQFPHVDQIAEHAKFCDHWHAKPGKDARKIDWNATYRNWIRRAAELNPTGKSRRQDETNALFDRAMARAIERDQRAAS